MKKGFTLVEILVVLTIIGILLGISIVGLSDSRSVSRDSRRKADLEQIRSGLELYKADCGSYPATGSLTFGFSLAANCLNTGNVTYITKVPNDPDTTRSYFYQSTGGTAYVLCAALENSTGGSCIAFSPSCGSSTCNYSTTNP